MKRLQLACLAALFIFLTGCGVLAQQPPDQAVRLAVAQQLSSAQQTIAQGLGAQGLGASGQLKPNFKIDRLEVKNRKRVSEKRFQQSGYPSDIYKVEGTVKATLTASNYKVQQSGPFKVYLGTNPQESNDTENAADTQSPGSQSKIETWFMIRPDEPKLPQ